MGEHHHLLLRGDSAAATSAIYVAPGVPCDVSRLMALESTRLPSPPADRHTATEPELFLLNHQVDC